MLKGDYVLRAATAMFSPFPPPAPPVNAFWSVTMYDGKDRLLVENPINRYLINSPMLPDLQKNEDGSLTLHIRHAAPADPRARANRLPAPAGPNYLVMRLYWPKASGFDGSWKPTAIARAE